MLDQVRVSLHSVIITKIRRFGDLNVVVNIQPQADDYNKLIKMPSLLFSPVIQMKLNEFELRIDWKNILYWRITFYMGIVCTIPNTLAVPLIQKILKLRNNSSIILISNSKKQAYTAFDFSSGFYFFLYASQIKELKTTLDRAEKAVIIKNPIFLLEQIFLELIHQ